MRTSIATRANLDLIEENYQRWQRDPASVDSSWSAFFERIYAGSIGAEFMHIQKTRIRNWVRHRLESRPEKHSTSRQVQVALLRALLEAESFEVFLHSRYVGQKRFSLQGAESLMVILDT